MSRVAAAFGWRRSSPSDRSNWFRNFARETIKEHREYLQRHGLHHGDVVVYDFESEAIDHFAKLAIEDDRDDDVAVEAATMLLIKVSNASRGSIANAILYHAGGGKRVRATLLKHAWTDGKSGSVLALNGPGKTTLVEYFHEAGRDLLMDRQEMASVASLGPWVTIYRGAKMKAAGLRSTAYALSWSRDVDTARLFMRIGHGSGEPVLIEAIYPTKRILALWESSGREPEVIVDPKYLRSIRAVGSESLPAAA